MEQVAAAPENSAAPSVTSELPLAAVAAPADGVVATENQQPAEGEGAQAPQEPAPRQTPLHRQAQPRFADLTRERDAERAARLRLEGELEAYRRLGMSPQGAQPQPEPQRGADGPPDPNLYPAGEYDPQYQADLIDWRVDQRFEQREQRAQQVVAHQEGKARFDAVRADAIRMVDSDENGFIREAPQVLEFFGAKDVHMADVITSCENPADVAEYLGRGDNIRQLGQMAPAQREAWVSKVDAITSVIYSTCTNAAFVAEHARSGDTMRYLASLPVRDRAAQLREWDKQIGINLAAARTPDPQPAPAPQPAPSPSPAPTGGLNGRGAVPNIDPSKFQSFSEFESYAKSVWNAQKASN